MSSKRLRDLRFAVLFAGLLLTLPAASRAQEATPKPTAKATPKAGATPKRDATPAEADGTPAAEGTPVDLTPVADTPGRPQRSSEPVQTAEAVLLDPRGERAGTVKLTEDWGHVTLQVEVQNMTPGEHGIHIHAIGACEPPDFASAAGHFAPMQKQHGLHSPQGHHAGDLPNLVVDESGTGTLEFTTDRFTLVEGPWSLFDKDGSSIVVHAKPDDYRTDPAGNSGERVACGIVKVGGAAASAAGNVESGSKPAAATPPRPTGTPEG